jgi:hypothetical protein
VDLVVSAFTHTDTDVDDFAALTAEAHRVLDSGLTLQRVEEEGTAGLPDVLVLVARR